MVIYVIFLILIILISHLIGFILGLKYSNKEIIKINNSSLKNRELYETAIRCLKNPEKIVEYVNQKGYKKVCIYGMSYLGECLTDILRKSGIEVICGLDRNADKLYNSYMQIYKIDDNPPIADLIIVTTIRGFSEIKSELERRFDKGINIVSLEMILDWG